MLGSARLRAGLEPSTRKSQLKEAQSRAPCNPALQVQPTRPRRRSRTLGSESSFLPPPAAAAHRSGDRATLRVNASHHHSAPGGVAPRLGASSGSRGRLRHWRGSIVSEAGGGPRQGFQGRHRPSPACRSSKTTATTGFGCACFTRPRQLPNNLEYTIAEAKAARKLGYKFLLDYHYSDTWADPGKQFIPKAWEGLSHAQLVKAVFEYTRDTWRRFATPAYSRTWCRSAMRSNGMLWPDGKLRQLGPFRRSGEGGYRGRGRRESANRRARAS